jgi:predicted nucleotidyltransferase
MSVIRRVARQIGEQFRPEQVILFGSYAYGKPHRDSDVDLLVVMPARNQIDQAVKIRRAIDPPFSTDILVRTPHNLSWRLKAGDSLLHEIVSRGKVLYGSGDRRVGAKGRSGSDSRDEALKRRS